MIRLGLVTIFLLLAGRGRDASAQQQPDPLRGRLSQTIKVIPVPHLVTAQPALAPLPCGTMLGGGGAPGLDSDRHNLLTGDRGQAEGAQQPPIVGDLAELARSLTPLTWTDGGCRLELVGDALLVTGSPDQVHIVEQSLAKVLACLGEPVRLSAAIFTVAQGADLPAGGVSYADLRTRLTQLGAQVTWEGTAAAMPGRCVELAGLQTTTYVADSEVEIAQSSTMADPAVLPLHTGTALHVQAHALHGTSDLVLMAQFAHGDLVGPMRDVNLGSDDTLPRLQSPRVAVATGALSGRVRNGGALTVLADGFFAGRRLGIVIAAERPAVPADLERDLGIFPLSAFLSRALRARYQDTARERPDVWTPPLHPAEEPAHRIEPGDDSAWLALCQRALGEEPGDVNVSVLDGRASVRGSAAAKATIARLIEMLQDQFLRTVEVECRLDEWNGKSVGVAQRLRFPALLGRNHGFTHGTETTLVWDENVEVAQKAGVADPKVARHFSGTVCAIQPYALGAQDLAVHALIRVTDTVPERTFDLGSKRGIPLDQAAIARARFAHDGRVPSADGTIDFGEGPALRLPDRTIRTRQTLSLKAR